MNVTSMGTEPRSTNSTVRDSSGARKAASKSHLTLKHNISNPSFPIDIVYTWVDGSDIEFQESMKPYLGPTATWDIHAIRRERFTSHDELRYSLRSVEEYAPWINQIYIVTNGQKPDWLKENARITLISHNAIIEADNLPTFNSRVIESSIHKIPGLSEHYLYFSDDVMLLKPILPDEVFTAGGIGIQNISNVSIPDSSTKDDTIPFYFWATMNARDLIQGTWGQNIPYRFSHIFQPQRKSVAEYCEHMYRQHYARFRKNRFRAKDDVLCCHYLHPATAYYQGKSIITGQNLFYIRIQDEISLKQYDDVISSKGEIHAKLAMCLNDAKSDGSALFDYRKHLAEFLESYYPHASSAEAPLNRSE